MTAYIGLIGKELLRKRVFLMTILLTVLFLGFYLYGLNEIANSHNSDWLVANAGQAAVMFIGLFFSQMVVAFFVLFSSMGAIAGEAEAGILYAIMSRPIPRWRIFLGKWIGFAVWYLLFAGILFWAVVGSANYFFILPISGIAFVKAFLLFELIPLLLLSLSMLGSAYLPMLGNGVLGALLYGLGLFGGMLENAAGHSSSTTGIENFGLVTSLLSPTNSIFQRMIYELLGGFNLPIDVNAASLSGLFSGQSAPSTAFIVYSLAYLIVLLAWGMIRFSRKDIT